MTTIDILKSLLKLESTVELKEKYSKYYCDLDEPDCEYKLTINNLPKDTIIIKADKFPAPSRIFNGSKMECKRADYIIVTEYPTKIIFYIELKSSKKSAIASEILAQLLGAKCLMEYCKAIGKEFWKSDNFLDGYDVRYVRYVAHSLEKRATRRKDSLLNNTPERARIIKNCTTVQYKQLS